MTCKSLHFVTFGILSDSLIVGVPEVSCSLNEWWFTLNHPSLREFFCLDASFHGVYFAIISIWCIFAMVDNLNLVYYKTA